MSSSTQQMMTESILGAPLSRLDGPQKVTGEATYASEYEVNHAVYAFPIQSTVARGRIVSIDSSAALAVPGVLMVLSHENAPRLVAPTQAELAVLQSDLVSYRGQFIAVVIAETLEVARQAAEALRIQYEVQEHDVELSQERTDLYKPEKVNAGYETDAVVGDVESALAAAEVTLDQTYRTPAVHNNPMEPHATIAIWERSGITLYDSNQGAHSTRDTVAKAFGLAEESVHVISSFVGGGFGSKGFAKPHVILTVMAARAVERPVKCTLTRQHLFAVAGYRTPTIQHIRLGARADGRLTAIAHEVVEQTSHVQEFAEQTAVATRMMYAAPNRLTTHRLAKLDVPTPSYMRAPGECPGMFALESAMDELAVACGLDPIELRVRNEPQIDPDSGHPFSSRGLVACFREGARRFGWEPHAFASRQRQEGRWLTGTGVAASTYPTRRMQAEALIHVNCDGQYNVAIDATDIGTGAWTILTQIAADALEVPLERVHIEIGDSRLPRAFIAAGSMGTASWGTAIVEAARTLRQRLRKLHDIIPDEGLEARGEAGANPEEEHFAMHAFGAQFAEVRVDRDTGEVRVPRLCGVFAVGRIMNAKTARSQFLGGMTMGLSMALHEESVMDLRFGDYVNHDFAAYHIATNADVGSIDIAWIEEHDPYVNPMGAKGIGEIGIVGTAAAIANAVYDATHTRIRTLPITPDKLL